VIRPLARAAALFVVAPFLTFASAVAAQHVHEPGPDHHDDHAVAHSHFAPHGHAATHEHPTEIEHDGQDNGHVVWIDGSALHESPYRPAHVLPAIGVTSELVVVEFQWSVTPFDDAAPPHGPPKPVDFVRGPPPSLV